VHFALSTHLFHGEPLARAHLETLKRAGFDDVELFATRTHWDYQDVARTDEIGEWLQSLAMRAGSIHAPICSSYRNGEWGPSFSNASTDIARRDRAVDETAAAIRAGRRLGASIAVLHLGLPRGQQIPPGDNDVRSVGRSLEQLTATAAETGMQLALEVIPNDLSTPPALLDWLTGDLENASTGICLDVGHAHLMGGTAEAAESLAGYVITTHLHDNRGRTDDHLVPFAGTIDWSATLSALWKIGYDGRLVFEVADAGDAPAVLQRTIGARTRLQAILNDLSEPFDFKQPDN
jgi:sugar phosphate isomerase/epimerase